MKKYILIILAITLLIPAFASAQETAPSTSITFAWDQAADDITDRFGGWRIYGAQTAGGPYERLVAEIPYEGDVQDEYTHAVPKAEFTGEWWFVARAFNPNGESADSNEVRFNFDVPSVPVNFRLILVEGGAE